MKHYRMIVIVSVVCLIFTATQIITVLARKNLGRSSEFNALESLSSSTEEITTREDLMKNPQTYFAAQQKTSLTTYLVSVQQGSINVADVNGQNSRILVKGENPPLSSNPDRVFYDNPFVSPDGKIVIFKTNVDYKLLRLSLDDSKPPTKLSAMDAVPGLGVAFSPDGKNAGVALINPNTDESEFWAISLGDGTAKKLTTFHYQNDCGGGYSYPDDVMYANQTGTLGNRTLFSWVDDSALLMSVSCSGVGLQTIDLHTGKATIFHDKLTRAHISNDGKYVGGLENGALSIFDRVTRKKIASYISSGVSIDQFTWTPDGRVVFSTIEKTGTLALVPKNKELATKVFFYSLPTEPLPLWQTHLYLLDIKTLSAQQLWASPDWRGIPLMVATDHDVFFSAIQNMRELVQALNIGKGESDVMMTWPSSNIYRLSLENKAAPQRVIADGENPILVER